MKTIKLERHSKIVEPTLNNVMERNNVFKEATSSMKRMIEGKMDAKECVK